MAKGSTSKKTQNSTAASAGRKKTTAGSRSRAAANKTVGNTKAKSSKSTTKAKGRGSANVPVKEQVDYAIKYEIFMWAIIALAVIVFISLLGLCGSVGEAISGVCFGLFGTMAYLFPFVLLFLTAFLIANPGSRIARIKSAASVGLFIAFCGWLQIIMAGYNRTYMISEYYIAGSTYHTGGGLIGGAMTHFFASAIGIAGSCVIYLLMTIIFLILITQKSLFANVKKGGAKIYSNAKENKAARREWAQARKEERARLLASYDTDSDTLYDPYLDDEKTEQAPIRMLPAKKRTKKNDIRLIHLKEELPAENFPSENITTQKQTAANISDEPAAMDSLRGVIGAAATGSDVKSARLVPDFDEPAAIEDVPDFHQINIFGDQEDDFSELPVQEAYRDDFEDSYDMPVRSDKSTGKTKPAVTEKARTKTKSAVSNVSAEAADDSKNVKEAGEKIPAKPRVSQEEIQAGIESVAEEIAANEAPKPEYVFPPISMLAKPSGKSGGTSKDELMETSMKLQQVLKTFGVNARVSNVTCGPSITRFELIPEMGVKVSKIQNLQDDIKLNLAATDIRIEAPIPGKSAVGIEVPNKNRTGVVLRELIDSDEFKSFKSNLAYAVGRDISGKIIVSDIAKMPHMMIAGATGSGKSVFINTLIMSILFKAKPEDVKLIMIDPKVVELSVYNGIPHLYIPVVTDPKKAAGALNWAVAEMDKRYRMFEAARVREIKGYNHKIEELGSDVPEGTKPEKMPQIVIIVDELADLMMVASSDVETAICRLAQKARAAGIHLVIATQRPSVDVITGLIKANIPSRIAFSVSSGIDSRTVLDRVGAEKLIGNGDMLFFPQNLKDPLRLQGAFISDDEVSDIVDFIKEQNGGEGVQQEIEQRMDDVAKSASLGAGGGGSDTDELFTQAGQFIIEKDKASIGMLQRWFKIGFNRAARIMDQLADAGVVGPEEGTKPRKVLMSMEQFENYIEQN